MRFHPASPAAPRRAAAGRGAAGRAGCAGLLGLAALLGLLAGASRLGGGIGSLATAPSALPRLLARFETMPEPGEQPLALVRSGLYERLAEADRRWLPRVEFLPEGGVRYVYRRRSGEPELTLAEIRALLADPPRYEAEREAIHRLLLTLQKARVRVVLEIPRKDGAAAEWDHAARTLRIRPEVLEKGTVDFAEVLNHEAIHVAQSCAAGSVRTRPQALGLSTRLAPELERHLAEPLYEGASRWEEGLEREAYANQANLGIGATLVAAHCPLAA